MNGVNTVAAPKPVDPQAKQTASGPTKPTAEAPAPEAAGFETESDAREATKSGAEPTALGGPEVRPGTLQETPMSGGTNLDRWQNRLLPFMVLMISVLSFLFLGASAYQLHTLHGKIWEGTSLNKEDSNQTQKALFAVKAKEAYMTSEQVMTAYGFQALTDLEQYTVERRYHQANVLLMSRVWVRYLGFVTGMILALVGATFILGKMREPHVEGKGKMPAVEFSFAGTSPGIFLGLVGVALMLTTIVTHHEINVSDGALYVDDVTLRQFNLQVDDSALQSEACTELLKQTESLERLLDSSDTNERELLDPLKDLADVLKKHRDSGALDYCKDVEKRANDAMDRADASKKASN